MKIAIIGAGASGLSAANYLKKLGYHDVTVYEKNSYVGGKVFSYTYKDKMYDLGAIIFGKKDNYKISHELLTRFDIPLEEFVTPEILYMDGRQIAFEDYLKENYTVFNTLKAAILFVRLYFKFRGYFRKGFIHASPELFISFNAFVQKHKIESFADTLKPFFVGCGYGYYEDVPTIYLLRMLFWFVRSRLRLKGMIRTIEGLPIVWTEIRLL
ncbi:MAG: NAD(P)-binding protein [Candidatus Aminicenantes bacterium]|nr:NAD(P)-binding protein [Candidatus Aminicenantes bacterium]MDH5386048.1 NAD(P)-binding protein [Candidatus Aminicenantes bacterium]